MATAKPDLNDAKKRIRSPAYPYVSLPKAIEYARKFWGKETRNFASILIASTHLGFASVTGPAGQIIAALTQFGLMESSGEKATRKVKLTDHAIRILGATDQKSATFMALIKRSALLPKLYADLMSKYPSGLPSDASLRHELEYERGFNPGVVADVVRAFRETVSFANLDESGTVPTSEADRDDMASDVPEVDSMPESEQTTNARATVSAAPRKPVIQVIDDPDETERLRFNLKGGRRVRVMFTGHLPTQEDIDKLIKNLELNKDTFPETAEDEQ